MVTDPVCGMNMEPTDAVVQREHDGETYYFCSEECLQTFQSNPEPYI